MSATLIDSIYAPIQEDLRLVEENLRAISKVDTFPFLSGLLDHVLDFGGKHIRPAITLLASRFHPCDRDRAVIMATAVEALHIATLVHDDTVDQAEVRRGRATVSNRWGREVAVLLGDYLFARSASLVCETSNIRAMSRFAETVMALSAGELREYVACYDWRQTREQYWLRIHDKTASLFAAATETGAILGDAPEQHIDALRSYGHNLGMAFQVMDDILDFEGTETVAGKPVGNDLTHGVMTLPAILLAERFPADETIKALFSDRQDPDKLREAMDKIRSSSIMREANEIADSFCDKARRALDGFPDQAARRSLIDLTGYVTQRER
ncbi:MAG: polyprenyl synthetase family protein [Chloroflexi bacterium]|nr:polyprenyl synthetase family protein [Chloroflexota bacterium]